MTDTELFALAVSVQHETMWMQATNQYRINRGEVVAYTEPSDLSLILEDKLTKRGLLEKYGHRAS